MRRYLVEALNADLIVYAQQSSEYDTEQCAKYYGPAVYCQAYENPSPDFSKIFDTLRAEYNYDFNWRDTFKRVKSYNYRLGFDGPGTCIRRMYNRHLIYRHVQNADYDQYIVARSDLYFLDAFPINQCQDLNTLYSAAVGQWRGLNNNLLVFGAPLREAVLNYITRFLDGSIAGRGNSPTPHGMNEEEFFKRAMDLQKVRQATLRHNWFISADSREELCTWQHASIHKHASGLLYKYRAEFETAYKNAGIAIPRSASELNDGEPPDLSLTPPSYG